MIEIKLSIKGKNLEDILSHLNMIIEHAKLRKEYNSKNDFKSNGNTGTSSYEYSIININKITGVAIKHKDGIKSMKKGSHAEIIKMLFKEGYMPRAAEIEEGFILENGTFLNRKEAAKYAYQTNQINAIVAPHELYSYKLW